MPQQREVIDHLSAAGRRRDFFVMVGGWGGVGRVGGGTGADGYGETAADAVALAEGFTASRKGSASC